LDVDELASGMDQTIQIDYPIAMALERIGRQRGVVNDRAYGATRGSG
jgi:hypothetical protein